MSEEKIKRIADEADIIVSGYAYKRTDEGFVKVLNLNNPEQAAVLQLNGEMAETTMDDSTLTLVQAYFFRNIEFLEVENA